MKTEWAQQIQASLVASVQKQAAIDELAEAHAKATLDNDEPAEAHAKTALEEKKLQAKLQVSNMELECQR
eukprot:10185684-Karenia_brevis.AAC.1